MKIGGIGKKMDVSYIKKRYNELDKKLTIALSTMARKSDIYDIKKEMLELQKQCPHYDPKDNYTIIEGNKCPYCGGPIYLKETE